MNQNANSKRYDLEQRTLDFSKGIVNLGKKLPVDTVNEKLKS